MPSMRALMTAGPALDRDNTAGYNCSYLPVDDPKSFDEAMFVLLCGTGVGFSVKERHLFPSYLRYHQLFDSDTTIVVRIVKKVGLKHYVNCLHFYGQVRYPKWDMSFSQSCRS